MISKTDSFCIRKWYLHGNTAVDILQKFKAAYPTYYDEANRIKLYEIETAIESLNLSKDELTILGQIIFLKEQTELRVKSLDLANTIQEDEKLLLSNVKLLEEITSKIVSLNQ